MEQKGFVSRDELFDLEERCAKAIRTVVKAATAKNEKQVFVEIV